MMRTDLDHLPALKRRDLERVVRVLFASFDAAVSSGTSRHKRQGRILKVILFGSYARGDWVEDRASGYASDYDILVVVNHEELTDVVDYWATADETLMREVQVTGRISAPVNFIVHSLSDVNDQLARGRYFFSDIAAQGIALYEADDTPLATPKPLTEEAARKEALAHFEKWFPSAGAFVSMGNHARSEGNRNEAAFAFHQATERFYVCALLVLTLYSPKSHKLNFLRSTAERLAPELIAAWPRDTKAAKRCFELLRRAYVEARYSAHYRITDAELAWLAERIDVLQAIVRRTCETRLANGHR